MYDAFQNPLGLPDAASEEKLKQEFDRVSRERYEYCIKLASLFKGNIGKEILANWRSNTIESGTWLPSLAQQNMDFATAHGFAREGQNAFVKDIEECIKIANKCKTLEDYQNEFNKPNTVNNL